jgi:SPP1 family predicted phage head-tail adaptor
VIIGRLRHRVTIQQPTVSRDSAGSPTRTWATLGTVWAEVRTPQGFEQAAQEAGQVKASLTHTVRLRRPDFAITPACRVRWGSRALEVQSVSDPDNRGEAQILLCSEIVDQ